MKAIVEKVGVNDKDALFQFPWRRNSIAAYVIFMAGDDATNLEVYKASKELLRGNAFTFFCKESVVNLLDGEDADQIMADIKTLAIEDELKKKLSAAYEYNVKITDKHPNRPANVVMFSEILKKDTFLLTGHIQNYDGTLKTVKGYDRGLRSKTMLLGDIDNQGNFSLQIPIFYSHDISIVVGRKRHSVIANPGDHLHIEIRGNSLRFLGDGAEFNQTFREMVNYTSLNDRPFRGRDIIQVDPALVKQTADDRYNSSITRIETHFSDKDLPWLKQWAICQAIIDNYGMLMSFESYREYKSKGTDLLPIPPDFYDFKNLTEQLQPESLVNTSVTQLLMRRVSDFYKLAKSQPNTEAILREVLSMSKKSMNSFEYEMVFTILIGQEIEQKNFKICDPLIGDYQEEVKTDWLIQETVEQYELEKKVLAGLIIPENSDLNQLPKTEGDSLLTVIISKHKGKVIYIDIWATWCQPCLGEFAYAKEFHEGIDHDKVAMVYLAGKSKENAWKVAISKHGLAGDHYLLTDEQYDQIAAKLDSPGFPHYAIIDQNGVIKYKNAPRPSVRQEKLNVSLIEMLNTM